MAGVRNKFVKIRVTDEELAEFKKRAGQCDVSTYVRHLVLGQPLPKLKPKTRSKAVVVDSNLVHEVSRIGNNVNQIARHVNSSKEIDRDVLVALLSLQNSLDGMIQKVLGSDS